jgi:26S proteasome regulatory subunit N7
MADEVVLPIPNLALPQHLFTLSTPTLAHLHAAAHEPLLKGIKADNMAPYYKLIAPAALPLDQSLLDEMTKANEEELKELDERLAEAEQTEGESEISDALKARANYLTRIGEKVRAEALCLLLRASQTRGKDQAVAAQLLALEKTPGLGSRIDIVLTLVRIGFFFGDHPLIKKYLSKSEEYVTNFRFSRAP